MNFQSLLARVERLEKENLELQKLVQELRRRLLAYENAHTPPSKSKRKSLPKDEPSGKLGASLGHEKYERQQPEPTSTVEHKQDSCSNCGNRLGKKYKGIVTSDGHTAYKKIGSAQQRCWAHIIRESKTLNEEHKTYACHHANIKKIFVKVKQTRANPPPLEKRRELKKQLEAKATQIADALDGHTAYRTFAVKLRNATPALFTCIIHLFVEPTNNAAERALRELIVLRKIIGGLRREIGAHTLETIATVFATWKQQGKALNPTLKAAING